MGWTGLDEGHPFQANGLPLLLAPFRARFWCRKFPQATLTFGQCALGLIQVKAAGLVQAFDLL